VCIYITLAKKLSIFHIFNNLYCVLFPLNFFDLELDTAYIEHPFQALALIVLLKLFSFVSVSEIILL